MLKAVLFDMGGTLIHFEGDDLEFYRRSFEVIAQRHGGQRQEILAAYNEYVRLRHRGLLTLREATFQEAIERVAYNMSERELIALLEELNAEQLARASLYPETTETLSRLKAHGVRTGLVSNFPFPGKILEAVLIHFGIREHFEVVVSSSDVGLRKPHPDVFFVALEAMELEPQQTMYVGDAPEKDMRGAKDAGMKTAWINRKGATNPVPLPDYEITSLLELIPIVQKDKDREQRRSPPYGGAFMRTFRSI